MLLVVTDDRFLDHDPGPSHPECPARLTAALEGIGLAAPEDALVRLKPRSATEHEITAVHSTSLFDRIRSTARPGGGRLDRDTMASAGSFDAASRAAGAVLTAIEALDDVSDTGGAVDGVESAYCLVRPPGHHATPDTAMGFCLFNSVAIAARSLSSAGMRVAIVDFDAHHGNGTQDIFIEDPTVLYASIHQSALFPGTGEATDVGIGLGLGTTVNVPLPPGATGNVALDAIDNVIGPAVDQFDPDWLLISAGFDAHRLDPLTQLMFSSGDIADIMDRLIQLVGRRRTITILEGGYDLDAVRDSSAAVVGSLTGLGCRPEPSTSGGPGSDIVESVIRIREEGEW